MKFEELKDHLARTRNLKYLREKTNNVSNKLYLFRSQDNVTKYVLKGLKANDFEIEAYLKYLPKIKYDFETLIIPEIEDQYSDDGLTYLLLPYYDGATFDFNTQDIDLTGQLIEVVKDLSVIDVETIIAGGSNFDFKTFEMRFWEHFKKAITIELVTEIIKEKCVSILKKGRRNQKMIVSNGDFNPRNVIRLENGKIVLIDWNGIVSPLEHLLTYPWLLNWQNPSWQKVYASNFERKLPVQKENIQMHLMNISLQRAVGEKDHNNAYADMMAQNHIKNFYASLEGFTSLTELVG